jgi:hypothetical protein
MIPLMRTGGPVTQLLFFMGVLGLPLLVLMLGLWRRKQDITGEALGAAAAARLLGEPPLRQYELGRNAALRAARPFSSGVLATVLAAWVGLILVLGLVSFMVTPGPLVVTDILRGRLELSGGQTATQFAAQITRTLVSGSAACIMAIPGLIIAGLGLGYLRCWLLGKPLDRALAALVDDIDPEKNNPQLQATVSGLAAEAGRRWSTAGYLLGPFWLMASGRWETGLKTLVILLALASLGLGAWFLPIKLVWAGDPMGGGTLAGLVWYHLRDAVTALFILPALLHAATRGGN